jgi:hypothetical protein
MAARFVNDPRLVLYRREGQTLPSALIAGALVKWRWAPIGPLEEGVSEESDDEWLARLAYAARAAFGPNLHSDKTAMSKFATEFRLKPMSREMIEYYSHCRLVGAQMPVCPPLGVLRIKDLSGDVWRPIKARKWRVMRYNRKVDRANELALAADDESGVSLGDAIDGLEKLGDVTEKSHTTYPRDMLEDYVYGLEDFKGV